MPTPAASIFILSLPLILEFNSIEFINELIVNKWFLVGVTIILTYLMNAEIPLFSLKFKDYSWRNNRVKYAFLIATGILVIALQFIAVPLTIALYILLSFVENSLIKKSN